VNYKAGGRQWVIDSGCTNHMTDERKIFSHLDEDISDFGNITFGDYSKGGVKGIGEVPISKVYNLSNILLVDSLNFNLLSIAQLYGNGYKFTFTSNDFEVTSLDGKDSIFKGFRHESLYLVDFSSKKASLTTCLFSKASMSWLWHRRLGHVGMKQLNRLVKYDLVLGLKDANLRKINCVVLVKLESKLPTHIPTRALCQPQDHWNYYIWIYLVPLPIEVLVEILSLVIVDDYSRYTWVFFLHDKSHTCDIFKTFVRRAENEFEQKLKKVRSDNGSEFKNTNVEEFCDEKGVKHEFSTTYTPEQNGVVERKNRTLIEMARSMLDEYKVSDSFWAEAINTTCHA
jgi:hypothetical protein